MVVAQYDRIITVISVFDALLLPVFEFTPQPGLHAHNNSVLIAPVILIIV